MKCTYCYTTQKRKYSIRVQLRLRPKFNRGSIIITVYHEGQRLRISMGRTHIKPEHWDGVRQRLMINAPKCEAINKEIDTWIGKVNSYFSEVASAGIAPSIEGLKQRIAPVKQTKIISKSVPDSIEAHFTRFTKEHSNNQTTVVIPSFLTYSSSVGRS